jgi:hypothetical protein
MNLLRAIETCQMMSKPKYQLLCRDKRRGYPVTAYAASGGEEA